MNNMAPTAYYNWVFQWTVSTYTGLLFCELFVMLVDQQLLLNTWYDSCGLACKPCGKQHFVSCCMRLHVRTCWSASFTVHP